MAVKSVMLPDRDGDAQRGAVETALHRGQHQAGRAGGAGRGRHDIDRRGAGAAQVLVRQVQEVLIVGVGVHRGHESGVDPEGVVKDLHHRHEAVRGARGVRDHPCAFAGSKSPRSRPSRTWRPRRATASEMMTSFAPAARWAPAASRVVKMPVDSMTTSMSSSFQGRSAGFRSAKTLIEWSPTVQARVTDADRFRQDSLGRVVLERWALVAGGTRSFMATTSMSGFSSAARKKARPIRPKPFIATRVATDFSLFVGLLSSHFFEHGLRQFLHIVHEAISAREVDHARVNRATRSFA
jgi:hypothetical protein